MATGEINNVTAVKGSGCLEAAHLNYAPIAYWGAPKPAI